MRHAIRHAWRWIGITAVLAAWTGQPAAAADHEGTVVVYTAAQSTIVQAVGQAVELAAAQPGT